MMPPPPPPPPPASGPVWVEQNGQTSTSPTATALTITMNVVTTVTHMLLGAVAFSAFFFANLFNGSSSLTQHIYLCVVGYIILMSQAILTFSPHNGLAHSLKYPNKRLIHWVMQVVGSVLAIVGSIIRFTDVNNSLQTPHAILGLIAMILTIVSLIGGAANLIFRRQMSTLVHRSLHACVGSLTLSVAFVCLCFGFDTLYRSVMGDVNADLCIALTVIALVGTLTSVSMNMTRRLLRR